MKNPATTPFLSFVYVQRYRGRLHAWPQALPGKELNRIGGSKEKGASEDAP
jgi:hypothetical protein